MAGRIALDLKQFKHLSSDDHSSTLEHQDGHILTIAYKPLSKEVREQLKAMAAVSPKKEANKQEMPKQQKLAEGGSVKKYAKGDEVTLAPMAMPPQKDSLKEMFSPRMPVASDFPTEEEIQRSKEAEFQREMDKVKMASYTGQDKPGYSGQDPAQAEKVALDNLQSQKDQKDAVLLQTAAIEKAKEAERSQLDEQRSKLGLKPASSEELPQQAMSTPVEQQSMPIATSTPAATAVQQPQVSLAPGQDPASIMQKGYQSELTGISAEAAAKGVLGEKQADILSSQLDAQNMAMQKYEQERTVLEQERQAHMEDIKNGYIDPNKYWTGDPKTGEGGHSKIATAIGMIIAGFNPAGTPNAAIDFLNKQMERNIDAQAKNLQSKHNLLAENMRQFGNLKDAVSMTRIMQADIVQNQLLGEAAKATNPLAKAAALKAAGELQMKYAPEFQKFIGQRAVQGMKSAAEADPSKMGAYFAALDAADPTGKLRRDAEERSIPGVGFATSSEGAKGLREMGTTVKTVRESIARLKEISAKTGKSINPTLIAEADSIRSMLIGQLRVPITGPGAMSEGERELLMKAIPDVTALLSLDKSNIKRLDSIENKIIQQYRNQAQINGLNPDNIPGMQVIRRTPDGREAIFDANTKKFLRYKE